MFCLNVGASQSPPVFGVFSCEQKQQCELIKRRFVVKLLLDYDSNDTSIRIPPVSGRTNICMSDIMTS